MTQQVNPYVKPYVLSSNIKTHVVKEGMIQKAIL